MHTKRLRIRAALLALACAGTLVASTGGALASPVLEVEGAPPAAAATSGVGVDIECEDLISGSITPGPCPFEPTEGAVVQGDGSIPSGSSSYAADTGPPAAGSTEPALANTNLGQRQPQRIRAMMTLSVTPDRLRLSDAARDTLRLTAPRTVFMKTEAGGSFYRPAGRGNTFFEARVGGLEGRTVYFTDRFGRPSYDVTNCSDPVKIAGGGTLYNNREIPGGFAVVINPQVITAFTLQFTCDVPA